MWHLHAEKSQAWGGLLGVLVQPGALLPSPEPDSLPEPQGEQGDQGSLHPCGDRKGQSAPCSTGG